MHVGCFAWNDKESRGSLHVRSEVSALERHRKEKRPSANESQLLRLEEEYGRMRMNNGANERKKINTEKSARESVQ